MRLTALIFSNRGTWLQANTIAELATEFPRLASAVLASLPLTSRAAARERQKRRRAGCGNYVEGKKEEQPLGEPETNDNVAVMMSQVT